MNLNLSQWLFILPTDKLQGSEQIIMNQAKFVDENNGVANIIILTNRSTDNWSYFEEKGTIRYFPFPNYFLGIFILLPYFIFSNSKKYNYTFSSQTIINGTIGFAKRIGFLKNAKVIVRESNSIFELFSGLKLKIYKAFYKIGYKSSSLVICQTSYMKEGLIKGLQKKIIDKLHIEVLSNPINLNDIERKNIRSTTLITSDEYLVAAGRLMPVKGFDILINSFKNISELHPNLKLVILGEGKERKKLENLIEQLNLKDKIYLPGFVDNVYPHFKNAKVCVLSSRLEGFPNVLLQMMSQNTNVVATLSAGDIDEIEGLYTCKPGDESELTKSILECLQGENDTNQLIFKKNLSERTIETFNKTMLELIK